MPTPFSMQLDVMIAGHKKKYNKKEAAEIWSQQFKGFIKLYIFVALIDIAYQV